MNNEKQEIKEEWKDIIIEKNGITYDYSGIYQVSNMGRVKSLHNGKEKVIRNAVDGNGYFIVCLSKNKKHMNFRVNRLVATAFIPNPDNLPVVNHIDECKTNNIWTNLEWCTVEYNTKYSSHRISKALKGRKFTDDHKKNISESHIGVQAGDKNPRAKKVVCLETEQVFGCIKEAEEWCGKTGIGNCCKGKRKTCGGYHWAFYEDINEE